MNHTTHRRITAPALAAKTRGLIGPATSGVSITAGSTTAGSLKAGSIAIDSRAADGAAAVAGLTPAPLDGRSSRPPTPAMMRRHVAPESLPVTAAERARRAKAGVAGHCAIVAVGTVTRWTAGECAVVGVLEVDVPGLPGWTVDLSSCFDRPRPESPANRAALNARLVAARESIVGALMNMVPTVQAVHGRTLLVTGQAGGGDRFGRMPLGLGSAIFAPRGKAASKRVFDRAEALLDELLEGRHERRAAEQAAMRPLRMATDASRGGGRCGMAWVDEAGAFGASYAEKMGIDEAETRAVHAALKRAHDIGGARGVIVESDSRRAIEIVTTDIDVERIDWVHGGAAAMVAEARGIAADPRISVRWVRGHSGHPLNELADRLAMHRRRCGQWKLGPELIWAQQTSMVGDAMAEIAEWVGHLGEMEPVRVWDSGVAVTKRRLSRGLRELDRELKLIGARFAREIGSREDWGLAV